MKPQDYIKELAPRLPYGVAHISGYGIGIVDPCNMFWSNSMQKMYGKVYKIVLRPLSDLTKEITHNGETFVPAQILIYGAWLNHVDEYNKSIKRGYTTYSDIQKLLEWHFDINGWIDKGLAIDVNTLEVNCYE